MKTEYINTWIQKTKLNLIDCMGGKCQYCGYDRCSLALDFHHINPKDKDFTISSWRVKSWERLGEECKKCALLCANCHREVHAGVIDNNKLVYIFDEDKFISYKEKPNYKRKVNWDEVDLKEMSKTMNNRDICRKLGIKEPTLYKRMKNIGLKTNISPDSKWHCSKEELDRMINIEQLTLVEIGNKFGISDNAVKKKAKRWGIYKGRQGNYRG